MAMVRKMTMTAVVAAVVAVVVRSIPDIVRYRKIREM